MCACQAGCHISCAHIPRVCTIGKMTRFLVNLSLVGGHLDARYDKHTPVQQNTRPSMFRPHAGIPARILRAFIKGTRMRHFPGRQQPPYTRVTFGGKPYLVYTTKWKIIPVMVSEAAYDIVNWEKASLNVLMESFSKQLKLLS